MGLKMAYIYFSNGYRDQEVFLRTSHYVDVNPDNNDKIKIREWIEENCEKSVFIETRPSGLKQGVLRFYFGTPEDAMGFKMCWGEYV